MGKAERIDRGFDDGAVTREPVNNRSASDKRIASRTAAIVDPVDTAVADGRDRWHVHVSHDPVAVAAHDDDKVDLSLPTELGQGSGWEEGALCVFNQSRQPVWAWTYP